MKRTVLIAAVLTFAACSKAEKAPDDASSKEPGDLAPAAAQVSSTCALASDAELSDAIGAAVTAKEETPPNRCIFRTANPVVYADVEVERDGDAAWQGVNAGDSIIKAQQDSLAGIGDKAFYGPRDRLYVKKGPVFMAVEGGFDENARARALKVAKLISSKL